MTQLWSSLSLRHQIISLLIMVFVVMEAASTVVDVVAIRTAHIDQISHVGFDFVIEALPTLADTPPDELEKEAKHFDAAYRFIAIGDAPGVFSGPHITLHNDLAKALDVRLRGRGLAPADVRIAERQVYAQIIDGRRFRAIANLKDDGASQRNSERRTERATLIVISIKLGSGDVWFNFYHLSAPLKWASTIASALLDTAIALALAAVLVLVIRRVMKPLKRLATNAEGLGRGEDIDAVEPGGSADVRRIVDAFNRMSDRIASALDYQVALLRSLGHDLKGPLGRVRRIAEEAPPTPSKEALLDRLTTAEDIVRSVTTFTRATSRDGDVARIDLPSLLDALVEEQLDADKDARVTIDSPVTVRGRHNALSRAFRNLIENSVKYAGEVRVRLARDGEYALIEVEDDGDGIPADALDAAFRPFERLNADGPGSGLGLAIVKAIVVDHGGTVHLENRTPHGLKATVRLPIDPQALSEA